MHMRPPRLVRNRSVWLYLTVSIGVLVGPTRLALGAEFGEPERVEVTRPYPGITIRHEVYREPRPLQLWSVAIDLATRPEFVVTGRGAIDGFETDCQSTLQFAESTGVDLAINASAFAPFRPEQGRGMDVVGLAASDGDVYSPPDPRFGALLIDQDGRPRIVPAPLPDDLDGLRPIWDAVNGFHVLILSGDASYTECAITRTSEGFAGINPRTAVGLSEDRSSMTWIVADGRQPESSLGLTLRELADFGRRSGCHDLLNLDGGGSTTLVLRDPETGRHRVLNTPVGRGAPGTLRQVGNNLGVQIAK